MKLGKIIKSALIIEVPVVAALAAWIFTRGNSLIALSRDMADSFMVPRNMGDVMISGLTIWVPASFLLGLAAALLFYFSLRKRWNVMVFPAVIIGLGLLIAAGAFATGMPYKVEATGEVLIIALGFGLAMPWLVKRQAD